jgi:hypothetical protein
MNEESGSLLENRRGMLWFKRYLMLNALNTAILLMVLSYLAYALLGTISSSLDSNEYLLPVALISAMIFAIAVVIGIWVRILILRKYMPVMVRIGPQGITWKTSAKETLVPWKSLTDTRTAGLGKDDMEAAIVSKLMRSRKDDQQSWKAAGPFHGWILKRLMIEQAIINKIKEGYSRHVDSND